MVLVCMHACVRVCVQTMAEARQVLGQCTARWPDHAGLLHYTTHGERLHTGRRERHHSARAQQSLKAARACAQNNVRRRQQRRALCLASKRWRLRPARARDQWYAVRAVARAAYDEPDAQVASQGLAAGERLAEVATASCHALHMKSHLFLQLGNWTQVVDSNWRATLASDHFCSKCVRDAWRSRVWDLAT